MRALLISLGSFLALSLLVACGGSSPAAEQTAFDVWGVSDENVPTYQVADTIKDAPELLSVQIKSDGEGEEPAKQVLADFIESKRAGYQAIVARIYGDPVGGQYFGIYAVDRSAAESLAAAYHLDLDQMDAAGWPGLVFLKNSDQ